MPHDARSPFTPIAWTISAVQRGAVGGTASRNVPRAVARTLSVVPFGPVMKIRTTDRGVKLLPFRTAGGPESNVSDGRRIVPSAFEALTSASAAMTIRERATIRG